MSRILGLEDHAWDILRKHVSTELIPLILDLNWVKTLDNIIEKRKVICPVRRKRYKGYNSVQVAGLHSTVNILLSERGKCRDLESAISVGTQ